LEKCSLQIRMIHIFLYDIFVANWFTDIDECTPNQCQNGATCVDGINAYTCTCAAGYEGNSCQTSEWIIT
jgi:hypothetical protein